MGTDPLNVAVLPLITVCISDVERKRTNQQHHQHWKSDEPSKLATGTRMTALLTRGLTILIE
jgi:hypothetical protein